jgi:hypothetical protein
LQGAVVAEVRWYARGGNQAKRGNGVLAFGAAAPILQKLQSEMAEIALAFRGIVCLGEI